MLILTTKDTDMMNILEMSLLVYWIATNPTRNGFFWESTDKNSINSLNKHALHVVYKSHNWPRMHSK